MIQVEQSVAFLPEGVLLQLVHEVFEIIALNVNEFVRHFYLDFVLLVLLLRCGIMIGIFTLRSVSERER